MMIRISAVFVKLAHVGPSMAVFYRTGLGGLLLLAWVLAGRQGLWPGWRNFHLSLLCGLFFALDLYFWHRSIPALGLGLATIISNFQVFFLAACGALFHGERLDLSYLLAIPTGLGRVAAGGLHSGHPARRVSDGSAQRHHLRRDLRRLPALHPPPAAGPGFRSGPPQRALYLPRHRRAAGLGMDSLLTGKSFAIPDLQSWAALIGYGLFGQVLGWVIISRGLPGTPISRAGLILLTQPALAFVWDVLFFSRPTTLAQALGAAVALVAIYLGTSRR